MIKEKDMNDPHTPLTRELRLMLDEGGIGYSEGYSLPSGARINEDNVTNAVAADGRTLTFCEEYGRLSCDALSPVQAVAAINCCGILLAEGA